MTGKPIWSKVLDEIGQKGIYDQQHPPLPGNPSQVDIYRRSKIKTVQDLTARPLIVYATACTVSKQLHPAMQMIEPGDMTGFQAVTQNLKGKKLDVLIHSPGGYPDAAEAIVQCFADSLKTCGLLFLPMPRVPQQCWLCPAMKY